MCHLLDSSIVECSNFFLFSLSWGSIDFLWQDYKWKVRPNHFKARTSSSFERERISLAWLWQYLPIKSDQPKLVTIHRLSDLGLIPDKYALACSVISRLGRVFPQAIMFHLTSTLDEGDSESTLVFTGRRGLLWAASSGSVSLRIEGGLKSMELLVSVPRSDLLGVSGFKRELSPTLAGPNIRIWIIILAVISWIRARSRRR